MTHDHGPVVEESTGSASVAVVAIVILVILAVVAVFAFGGLRVITGERTNNNDNTNPGVVPGNDSGGNPLPQPTAIMPALHAPPGAWAAGLG